MYKKIIISLSLFFMSAIAIAQVSPFPTTPSGAIGAPIDGGLSLLLVAGAAYGAKKVYDFRNKEQEDEIK